MVQLIRSLTPAIYKCQQPNAMERRGFLFFKEKQNIPGAQYFARYTIIISYNERTEFEPQRALITIVLYVHPVLICLRFGAFYIYPGHI